MILTNQDVHFTPTLRLTNQDVHFTHTLRIPMRHDTNMIDLIHKLKRQGLSKCVFWVNQTPILVILQSGLVSAPARAICRSVVHLASRTCRLGTSGDCLDRAASSTFLRRPRFEFWSDVFSVLSSY
jgi:hypothetical protein